MKKPLVATLGLVVIAVAAVCNEVVAQVLTRDQIEAAIKAGSEGREGVWAASCSAGASGFSLRLRVTIEGPLERVRAKAAEAEKNFTPFGHKDVKADLLRPLLDVTVVSDVKWDQGARGVLYPTNVVILPPTPKGQKPVGIQPAAVTRDLEFTVTHFLNDRVDTAPGLKATFRISELPPEFDVAVVVTQDSNRRSCHFSSKAVSKVLGIPSTAK